jgi:hypothetical protein
VDLVFAVRRVEEDDDRLIVGRLERPGPPIGVAVPHRGPVLVAQGGDVAMDQGDVLAIPLDEDRVPGPSAERLEPQRAGAGEQVDRHAVHDQLAEDVEHRLAHQVAGGPGPFRLPRPVDLVPTALTRDDPHG